MKNLKLMAPTLMASTALMSPAGMGGGYGRLETKDEGGGGGGAPELATKDQIKELMAAVGTYQEKNDARLIEIEKKGSADPLIGEELKRIDGVLDGFEKYSDRITLLEGQTKALDELKESMDVMETAMRRTGDGAEEEKANRVNDWCLAVHSAHAMGIPNLSEIQAKTLSDVAAEYKALSLTPDTAGGYLAPTEYVREIIKGVTEISPVRSLARVRQTANKSIEIPVRTGQFAAQMVADEGTKTETTGLGYGLKEIPMHEAYALIDISNSMLEDSAFNMQSEIREESVEQFAVLEGSLFVSGTGNGRPEGFLVNGDVANTNSGHATLVTADALISLRGGVKSAYLANANYVLNRTTIASVRKLKDGQGQYLWINGVAAGIPNTIVGESYVEMTDMPSEGAGLVPIAFGDFRRAYTWVDRITLELLRDPYTQATSGRVRFIMRKRFGGQVTLAEAIRKMTCAV